LTGRANGFEQSTGWPTPSIIENQSFSDFDHRTSFAPKQPQRNTTNASRSNENAAKSTNLIDILPLIPVWLQFRVGIIR
jgi:hypothetical protein